MSLPHIWTFENHQHITNRFRLHSRFTKCGYVLCIWEHLHLKRRLKLQSTCEYKHTESQSKASSWSGQACGHLSTLMSACRHIQVGGYYKMKSGSLSFQTNRFIRDEAHHSYKTIPNLVPLFLEGGRGVGGGGSGVVLSIFHVVTEAFRWLNPTNKDYILQSASCLWVFLLETWLQLTDYENCFQLLVCKFTN